MLSPGLTSAFWPGAANSFRATRPFALQADIDDGVLIREADDAAGDDRPFETCVPAELLIEQCREIFHSVAAGRFHESGGG